MNTLITAELLWLVHRAVLGGVSAATGDPLPPTLAENKIHAVKLSHYGMALVAARLAGQRMLPLPDGVTMAEAQMIGQRLGKAGLLPELKSAVDSAEASGSFSADDATKWLNQFVEDSAAFSGMPGTVQALDAIAKACGGSVDVRKAIDHIIQSTVADKKRRAANVLFDRVAKAASSGEYSIANLASAFASVCQGLAASPPTALEQIAEPVQMEPRTGITIWDFNTLTQAEVAMLAEARGVLQPRSLRDCSDAEVASECERRGFKCAIVAPEPPWDLGRRTTAEPLRPEMTVRDLVELPESLIRELCSLRGIRLANEPLHVDGSESASCVADSAAAS
jgi:hypothetical protein